MRLPIVSTEYLFRTLSHAFSADLICDVGAFDCAHSKRFCRIGARVLALEANPHCFKAISDDRSVTEAGIEVFNYAAWNENGNVDFFLIPSPNAQTETWHTPISSVLERMPAYGFGFESVEVPAMRLDTFLQKFVDDMPGPIALWIDVEGAGYQVLEGIEHIRESICVVQVEVELERFWLRQYLWADVAALMQKLGFSPIARRPGRLQFDVIFVNDVWLGRSPNFVRWCVIKAWCRLRAHQILSSLFGRKLLRKVKSLVR